MKGTETHSESLTQPSAWSTSCLTEQQKIGWHWTETERHPVNTQTNKEPAQNTQSVPTWSKGPDPWTEWRFPTPLSPARSLLATGCTVCHCPETARVTSCHTCTNSSLRANTTASRRTDQITKQTTPTPTTATKTVWVTKEEWESECVVSLSAVVYYSAM